MKLLQKIQKVQCINPCTLTTPLEITFEAVFARKNQKENFCMKNWHSENVLLGDLHVLKWYNSFLYAS